MTEVLFALRALLLVMELVKLIRNEGIENDDAVALILSKAGELLGIPELNKAMPEVKRFYTLLKDLRAA